jgi:hypothetical protein
MFGLVVVPANTRRASSEANPRVILRGSRSAFLLTADLDAELYVTSTRRTSSSSGLP